jgi:hypothetical protein
MEVPGVMKISPSELEMWSRFPASRKLSYQWATVDGCPSALMVFTVVKANAQTSRKKTKRGIHRREVNTV